MSKTYSFYKIFGGFGLTLIFNIFISFITYVGLIDGQSIKLFDTSTWMYNGNYKLVLFVLSFQVGCIYLLTSQCRFIIISKNCITFINPLLPVLRNKYQWTDYDNYYTVKEDARGGPHEAVWLMKNGRIKSRISSFYYANYEELKDNLNLRYTGELKPTIFSQLFHLLGMKVK